MKIERVSRKMRWVLRQLPNLKWLVQRKSVMKESSSHCPVPIARPGKKSSKEKIKLVLGMDCSDEPKRATEVITSRHWPADTEIAIISILNPRLSTSRFSYMPEIAASIDCIYVGARGLSGIKRFLLGSVSGAVSSRAYCSVEVIRK
jgi:universal stress protein family protein